uniref:Uncharacterized protein n=1 Tax=viral metagenome TaxID=1070528 RepID=A0A6M3LM70_9ZZZZ
MFDWLKWLKYLPLLKQVLDLLKDAGKVPDDFTDAAKVQAWLHEAEPELVAVIVAVAEIVKEARGDDDPVIIGRLRDAIAHARD